MLAAILFILLVAALAAWWLVWRRAAAAESELARARGEIETLRAAHAEALAREQAQQHALFNAMIEGVLLLDATGRIRLANQALERLFNPAHDLRGQTIMEAFRLHELQELVNRAQVEGQVQGHELELPGLESRSLQVNAAVMLDRDGRQQGMLLVFHDLTRLKELENTRRDFVANVSHELRTPLSLIKGYCETLIDGAKDDPAVASRFLQTIEKHADRLTYLIEDLLTISRLESGQLAMNAQPLELAPLAQRTLDELAGKAAAKSIVL
ncbi:MAG: PAS domain-containing protein, partial [Verrucomicrobia bacterium]|nr:PAS domain-containing protein [Verrucomicrobiota bacterium]